MSPLLDGHRRERLLRIDLSREGDWNGHLCTIWTPGAGYHGCDGLAAWHPSLRPALELYYDDGWIGLPCGRAERGGWAIDEAEVARLVEWATT